MSAALSPMFQNDLALLLQGGTLAGLSDGQLLGEFLARGATLLFVSHDPQQVVELCKRAVWIHDGRVVMGWRSGGRYLPLQCDIASVAFWYQSLPTASFPAVPGRDSLEII